MSRAVVHRTKGLLDLRAITVMGLSVKPSTSNPIGMFGTGLKYAIATLCRHGAAPVLWIGTDQYRFAAKPAKFRGAEYSQLRMRIEKRGMLRPAYSALPYTTEYGKFWSPWMAFRELESNTRDEGGETFLIDDAGEHQGIPGETHIVVDLPEYVHAWTFRDEIFLPGGLRAPDVDVGQVQAIKDGPRDKLYWRGLRVKDIDPKRTVRTWNFLGSLQLTEDRTLASEWSARFMLACFIAQSENEELIRDVICADNECWEHRLDWPHHITPSETFQKVAMLNRGRSFGVWGYVSGHVPRAPRRRSPWEEARRPWRIETDADDPRQIVDANGSPIFARPEDFDPDDWLELAEAMCSRINERGSVGAVA